MSVNKNALIRYKTIDKCLQNRYRKWTLDNLIDACSDALYELEGKDTGVSKRTIQADIQIMRSDKLGYFAPIVVVDKRFYTYEDPEYSITNIPLTEQDLSKLSEAVEFMKQFQGFSHFKELDSMVQKLEDHIHSQKTATKPVIDFEKNDNLKGLEHLDTLYNAIIKKQTIHLVYKSFKARMENSFDFYPYLLKEFRNRWFIIGQKNKSDGILNLALDRIISVAKGSSTYREPTHFEASTYFQNVIGVSVAAEAPLMDVHLFIDHAHAPYITTKPLHHSQKVIAQDHFGVTVSLRVLHNFELEKEILSFGESIKVLEPPMLKRRITDRLKQNISNYQTEVTDKNIQVATKKLEHRGYAVLNNVIALRDVRKLKKELNKKLDLKNQPNKNFERALFVKHPDLVNLLLSPIIQKIVMAIDKDAFVCKAIYLNKTTEANWYVTWHQDTTINVIDKIETDGYHAWTQKDGVVSVCPPTDINKAIFTLRIHLDDADAGNGALEVIPGSYNKVLTDEEKNTIITYTKSTMVEVNEGGVMLMKPLLLHRSSKATNQRHRRVVHIEFVSQKLANGLQWAEELSSYPR